MTTSLNGARVFPTVREAIHATATGVPSMKGLAAELDMSPSELSHRTTLGGESSKPFPADDNLVRLQRATGDFSVLATMANLCGFELRPKEERMPDVVTELAATLTRMMPAMQMVMEWGREQNEKKAPDGKGEKK
jgi:regulatory protein CII